MIETPLAMVGAPGSPYSRKLRAALRFRRIPYRWIQQGSADARLLPRPRVDLLPQLILPGPDGRPEARVDSTPLLRELERLVPERSLLPDDPALAFVDALLEDYGDEWLTKCMFHYRWAFPEDVAKARAILPRWSRIDAPEEKVRSLGEVFAARQIERLWVVGSNETTAPVIEASYRRLLEALSAHLETLPFLLGRRPAACDFALYGQLTQLVGFDPTPSAVALDCAPRVVAWVDRLEDLSGLEPEPEGWIEADPLPPTLRDLMAEVGRVYVPFLVANARALARGEEEVRCRIDGRDWVQRPFPYQGKCLAALREAHAALSGADRVRVEAWLAETGCGELLGAGL